MIVWLNDNTNAELNLSLGSLGNVMSDFVFVNREIVAMLCKEKSN